MKKVTIYLISKGQVVDHIISSYEIVDNMIFFMDKRVDDTFPFAIFNLKDVSRIYFRSIDEKDNT